MNIYEPITSLKGVGPKVAEKFHKASIFNILDLLLYFPRDYVYISSNTPFEKINGDEKQILTLKVLSIKRDIKTQNKKTITTIEFEYGNCKVIGKWFNQPYIKNSYKIGETYCLLGTFKRMGKYLEAINPLIVGMEALKSEIIPKYPLKADISEKLITKLVSLILDTIIIEDNLPEDYVGKYNLISLDLAIREIHFPKSKESLEKAIIRLKYQELFTYSLKLLMIKYNNKNNKVGLSFPWREELSSLKEKLPFKLTEAQNRVIRDILRDQKSISPMNRLLQGDVGSGKTIVALIAIYNVYTNGYKSAFMVPTEILANQHYEEAKKLFKDFNVNIELLTGSTKAKEKERIKLRIKEEEPVIIIGTHALIQDDVDFNKLGLIVTDEQHRFGVEQRSKLINKGISSDVLVMTATPIPRTLALYIYSDLDVSQITELPPGRIKIDTRFYGEKSKSEAYKIALSEIKKGRQVYIVCPLIDEDEKEQLNSVESVYTRLKDGIFKDIPISILHGKMKAVEKDTIINKFKDNEIKVIISTTVIEVGVNVPNASVMIIENAERFGLAQLHQLRGRVGRGEYASYCLLIGNAKSNVTKKRMEIMQNSTDGFFIAEQDLKLRGSGEIFGMRQSGEEGLLLADLYEDMKILKCATKDAKEVIENPDCKSKNLIYEIMKSIEKSKGFLCFN